MSESASTMGAGARRVATLIAALPPVVGLRAVDLAGPVRSSWSPLIAGAATLAARVRAPVWAQLVVMLVDPAARADLAVPERQRDRSGILPTTGTIAHFNELLAEAGVDIRDARVPVPTGPPAVPHRARHRLGPVVVDLARGRPAPAGARRAADAGDLLGAGAVYADERQLPRRSWSARWASSGCWSPTTSTGCAGSAAGSPATAATSTSGSRRRWPRPAAGSRWSACVVAVVLPLAVPGMTSGLLTVSAAASATARARRRLGQARPDQPVLVAEGSAAASTSWSTWQGDHRRPRPVLPAVRRRRRPHLRGLPQPLPAGPQPAPARGPAVGAARRGQLRAVLGGGRDVDRLPDAVRAHLRHADRHRRARQPWLYDTQPAGHLLQQARRPATRTTGSTSCAPTTPKRRCAPPPRPTRTASRSSGSPRCRRSGRCRTRSTSWSAARRTTYDQVMAIYRLLLGDQRLPVRAADRGRHLR